MRYRKHLGRMGGLEIPELSCKKHLQILKREVWKYTNKNKDNIFTSCGPRLQQRLSKFQKVLAHCAPNVFRNVSQAIQILLPERASLRTHLRVACWSGKVRCLCVHNISVVVSTNLPSPSHVGRLSLNKPPQRSRP